MKENQSTTKIPFNLQFFADPEPTPEPGPTPTPEPNPEPQLSLEEQLNQIRLENIKLKKATDSATSEAANYKKQLKAKLSADEIALQEKAEKEAEREEQFNALVKENAVNKLEKSFLTLGYQPDKAKEAAEAQYDGDVDALFKIQSEHQANLVKQKEAEWIKSRPNPQGGNGDDGCPITKEQFSKFGYTKRVEFKAKYPETYKKYIQ